MARPLAALLLAVATPAQDMLGVEWDGTVYRLDAGTGTGWVLGPSGLSGLNALAVDSGGQVWSVQRRGSPPNDSYDLVTIDATSGVGQVRFANTPDIRGLAFRNGALLGIVEASPTDELWRFDTTTGNGTRIGPTGYAAIQGLCEWVGQLYAFDVVAGLLTVAPNGVATDVNPSVGGPLVPGSIQFLCSRGDGNLLGGRIELYELDPVTGAFTLLGGGGVYFDLRGADVIPTPCVLAYGSGCAGSGGLVPALGAPGCFAGGASASLVVTRGQPGMPGALLIGVTKDHVPLGACALLVGALLPATIPLQLDAGGSATTTLLVPVGGAGLSVTFQGALLDPGLARGWTATNGLQVVLQ